MLEKIKKMLRSKYSVLILINVLYCGISLYVVWRGASVPSNSGSFVTTNAMIFLLSIPVFSIFYGIYSYISTRKIITPNIIIFFVFPVTAWIINEILSNYYNKTLESSNDSDGGMMIPILIAAMSMGVSLITKLMCSLKESRDEIRKR